MKNITFVVWVVIIMVFMLVIGCHMIAVYRIPKARLYYEVILCYRENRERNNENGKKKFETERTYYLSNPLILPFIFPFRYLYSYDFEPGDTLDYPGKDPWNEVHVVLDGLDVSGFDFGRLRGIHGRIHIYLGRTNVSDSQLKTICQFKNIEQIFLTGCKNITDAGIREIANLENLKMLYLYETNATDIGVRELKDLPKLGFLGLDHTTVDGSAFCTEVGWKGLRILYLQGCVLADEFFDFVSNIPLFQLSFSVNDDNRLPPNIENLLKCHELKGVNIYGKNLKNGSDEGLPEEILAKLRTSLRVYVVRETESQ